jgi:CRP-like cAMP-binding protein
MTLSLEEKIAALKKVPYFVDFEDAHLSILAEELTEATIGKKKTIIEFGDLGEYLYILIKGTARIISYPDGVPDAQQRYGEDRGKIKEAVLDFLREGDFFGELSLIDRKSICASVVATTDVRFLKLSRGSFEAYLEGNKNFSRGLLTKLGQIIRRLNQQLVEQLMNEDPKVLLARKLVSLVKRHGYLTESGTVIDLELTHKDLSNMIGTSRSTVSRELQDYRKKGWIRNDKRKRIEVMDLSALEEYGNMDSGSE